MNRKALLLDVFCILATLSLLLYTMYAPNYGEKPFTDTLGYWLLAGIWGSLISALLVPLILQLLFENNETYERFSIIWVCGCVTLACFLFAGWVYGEKQRFAKLAVVETKATVIEKRRLPGFRSSDFFSVKYQYIDANHETHIASEGVNSSDTWREITKTNTIIINYLKDDPSVSRIAEKLDIKAILVKLLCVFVGLSFIALIPRWLRSAARVNENIDDFLTQKILLEKSIEEKY